MSCCFVTMDLASSLTSRTFATLPAEVTPSSMLGLISMATSVNGGVDPVMNFSIKTMPNNSSTAAAAGATNRDALNLLFLVAPGRSAIGTGMLSPNLGKTACRGRLRKVPSSHKTTI
ncbi:hypothetical protein D3C76_1615990 [compost metagenome]